MSFGLSIYWLFIFIGGILEALGVEDGVELEGEGEEGAGEEGEEDEGDSMRGGRLCCLLDGVVGVDIPEDGEEVGCPLEVFQTTKR